MLFGVIRKAVSIVAVLGLAGMLALPAAGQDQDPATFEESGGVMGSFAPSPGDIQELYNTAGLDVLDASAFGDHVDIDTGALSFNHTDVSLPGNSNLPVSLGRKKSGSVVSGHGLAGFGDWIPNIPHIRQKFLKVDSSDPEFVFGGATYNGPQPNRCTGPIGGNGAMELRWADLVQVAPAEFDLVLNRLHKSEFYDGIQLVDASGSSHPLLLPADAEFIPADKPRLFSKSNWKVDCIDNIPGGHGEGFIATAPDGSIYRFDKRVEFQVDWQAPERHIGPVYTELLFVSRIEDVHGNWVNYTYDGDKLARIEANDGRRIDVTWDGHVIRTVRANGRTWRYSYSQAYSNSFGITILTDVVRPDGTSWDFGGNQLNAFGLDPNDLGGPCRSEGVPAFSVKHPHGSMATFEFAGVRHGRMNLPLPILGHDFGRDDLTPINTLPSEHLECYIGNFRRHPTGFWSIGVTSKTVTVPQDGTHVWTWDYDQGDGVVAHNRLRGNYVEGQTPQDIDGTRFTSNGAGDLDPIKKRTTTKPDGSYMVTYINREFGMMEGQIEKIESYSAGGALLQTEVFSYEYSPAPIGFGTGQNFRQQSDATRYRVYQTSRILTQDGTSYTTAREFQTDPSAADFAYGAPKRVTQSSSLQSDARITETTYEHNRSKWILGLPKTVTRNGKLFDEFTYDGLGRRVRHERFGALIGRYGYHTDPDMAGALRWYRDGLDRVSGFFNYKRGRPQQYNLPNGGRLYETVDDNGWITSQTNARGFTSTLTYDAGGRVTRVNRPGNLTNIDISYSGLGSNLVRTVTEGSQRTTTKHDGFLRPYETHQQALSGGGGSIYTRTEYDSLGRPVFQSFPQISLSATTTGVTTTYDGLGRVTQTRENVTPFATTTTAYLSNNRTRVTDPEGNVTTTSASGYASPGDGNPTLILQPHGVRTDMVSDIYGNMTAANRNGVIQRWRYDSRLRLCSHTTPETGTTKYQYDNANQVISYAEGQTSQACDGLPSSRVYNTYDQLGRLTLVNYPGSTPDTSMTYDANGNVLTNNRGGANWTYTYDETDQLTKETLRIDGRAYWGEYEYNTNGAVSRERSMGGRWVDYTPDGFGRPTRLHYYNRDYVSGVSYFPNGAIKGMTYHNGQVMTATQNARQQTVRSRTAKGSIIAFDSAYTYDANSQITAINDQSPVNDDRVYTYDDLNRLKTASGQWGNGSYTYDRLNNITGKTLGARTVLMAYDPTKNRLYGVDDSVHGDAFRTYTYDTRGNVTNDGTHGFVYDHANQPVAMSGAASASFQYDGNYKRVKQTINGETIYSVYDSAGTLLLRHNVTTNVLIDYFRLGTLPIARILSGDIHTLHTDHLGSVVSATDNTGQIVYREAATPYGELINPAPEAANDLGFTGHIRDTDTGLTYMQARYYDPVVGRFLSNDPVGFAQGGVDYFNRYSYTANNPVNLIDPTGRSAIGWSSVREYTNPNAPQPEPLTLGEVAIGILTVVEVAAIAFDIATIPSGEGLAVSAGIQGIKRGIREGAETAMQRGVRKEGEVLQDLGLPKNNTRVSSPEGNSIPDSLTDAMSVEIKDCATVSCTRQVRIQTDAASEAGRESVLVTGTNTRVTQNAEDAFDRVIRRDDLGPQ